MSKWSGGCGRPRALRPDKRLLGGAAWTIGWTNGTSNALPQGAQRSGGARRMRET
jgi:hypothetical protein